MKKYLRHKISKFIDITEICAFEYINFYGKFSHDLDSHDFYEMCYVESGEIGLLIDKHEFVIHAGEMIFISPKATHIYIKKNTYAKVFCVCFVCLSPYLKLLTDEIITADSDQTFIIGKIIKEGTPNITMNQAEQLILRENQEIGSLQIVIGLLEYLTLITLRHKVGSYNSLPSMLKGEDYYFSLVQKIKQYCIENVKKKLTLDLVCNDIGYSRSFVCNLFKKKTGESIFTYFNNLKIEEAKKLLISTNDTATQISEILGFSDVKYFMSSFKKATNLTPIEFRKKTLE